MSKRFCLFLLTLFTSLLLLVGCNTDKQSVTINADKEMIVGLEYKFDATIEGGKFEDVKWSFDHEGITIDVEKKLLVPTQEGTYILTAQLKKAKSTLEITVRLPKEYKVTYELNGGTGDGLVEKYDELSNNLELVAPTKEGYVFKGYYNNPEFNYSEIKVLNGSMAKDLTLYAKWEKGEMTDSEKVSLDKEALSIPTSVSGNFELPQTGANGSLITWKSNNEAIKVEGSNAIVTRGDEHVEVILTATLSIGSEKESKAFTVTVAKLLLSDEEKVAFDKEELTCKMTAEADFVLALTGNNGSTITWSSSNESVIKVENGKAIVTRANEDK